MFVRVYDNKQVEVKRYKVANICVVVPILGSVFIFDRQRMIYVCDLNEYSYIHVENDILDEFIFITNPTVIDLLPIIDKCQFILMNEYMYGHDYFMIKKLKIVKDSKIYRFKVNRWSKTCDIEIK